MANGDDKKIIRIAAEPAGKITPKNAGPNAIVGVAASKNAPNAERALDKRTVIILYVEDDAANRALLPMQIDGKSREVLTAKDAQEALTILRDIHVDLVITNTALPKMDGFEFMARMKEDAKTASIPVIVLSSTIFSNEREKSIEMGAKAFFAMPAYPTDLKEAIGKICPE